MKRWTVGNRSRCKADLYLNDETVSALHAELMRTDDGRWMIQDRESTNGTARFVNGQWVRIRQAYISPDDRLRFGRAETSVRQLLNSRRADPAPGQKPESAIPWMQDLAFAFSHIRDLSELKKNLLFVLDLLMSPADRIIRCAERRIPVNPFSFMIFGGIIYTMISGFGLTASSVGDAVIGASWADLFKMFLKGIPEFILPLTLTLIYNTIPFRIFRRFAPRRRSFNDFMRLMAVVNGMDWMLLSFLLLFVNDRRLIDPSLAAEAPGHAIMTYVLFVIIITYVSVFNVIAQKHFWKISYAKATACLFLTVLVVTIVLAIIFAPIILIAVSQN
jgi:FHA domain